MLEFMVACNTHILMCNFFFSNTSDLFSQLGKCFAVVKPFQVIVIYFANLFKEALINFILLSVRLPA